jgi:hypothetical protein
MLVANRNTAFCVPVIAKLHEGAEVIRQLQQKDADAKETEKIKVVTLMANLAKGIAGNLKEPCIAVLDAYFAVGPTFAIAKTLGGDTGQRLLHIVTRAKNNIVAREEQPQAYSGKVDRPNTAKR